MKIFTADKIQLRQNIAHSGHRPLALDMAGDSAAHKLAAIWGRDVAYVLNIQHSQRVSAKRQVEALRREKSERQAQAARQAEAVKQSESVKQAERVERPIQKPQTIQQRIEIPPRQTNKPSRGMRI